MKVCTVSNRAGRVFNCKRVDTQEWYGSDPVTGKPCLRATEILIEFWDASYSRFGSLGQFVSRYTANTLIEHDPACGLNLDGGNDVWQIDAAPLREALTALLYPLYRHAA